MLHFEKLKDYWLTIDPHTYLCAKGNDLLLYNSLSGELRCWWDTHHLAQLGKKLCSSNHIPVKRVSGRELTDDLELREFVTVVQRGFSGDLVDAASSSGEPLQIMPTTVPPPNTQANPDRSLRAVTVYLNTDCHQGCDHCTSAHLQVPTCGVFASSSSQLPLALAEGIFDDLKGRSIVITLVGGDVFAYPFLAQLIEQLTQPLDPARINLRAQLANVPVEPQGLDRLAHDRLTLRITVPWGCDQADLLAVATALRQADVAAAFAFLVRSETDVAHARKVSEICGSAHVRLVPYFDGNNRSFFEQHVFLDYEQLNQLRPSLANIWRNTVLNRASFGTLVVRSNGDIFASVSAPPLGNIRDCTLADAAARELASGDVWLRTRGSVTPCKDCVFHNLCPPLSRYEEAMGRNNLCHIRDDELHKTPTSTGLAV